MSTWKEALREGMVSGTLASLLSTAYLMRAGARRGEPAAPVNAPSHWIFGDPALREDAPRMKYTATGLAIHHAASLLWGVVHARAWGTRPRAKRPVPAAAGAVATAAVACLVDYRLTPKRLNPGFEHRLTSREMVGVYAWFALGLMAGSMLVRPRRPAAGARAPHADGNVQQASADLKAPAVPPSRARPPAPS